MGNPNTFYSHRKVFTCFPSIKLTVSILILLSASHKGPVIAQNARATACYGSVMFLSCIGQDPNSWGTLLIRNGSYGTGTCPEYGTPFCCSTNTTACRTLISDSDSEFYQTIETECNDQYQCSIPVNRTTKPAGCWVEAEYTDVMTIYYTCNSYVPSSQAAQLTTTTVDVPTSNFYETETTTSRNGISLSSVTIDPGSSIAPTIVPANNMTGEASVYYSTETTEITTTISPYDTTSSTTVVEDNCTPFYRNWIFIGMCALVLVLLIIIIILSVCLCRKGNSAKTVEEFDDEGGFRRPPSAQRQPSVRHYQHPLFEYQPNGGLQAGSPPHTLDFVDLPQQADRAQSTRSEEADDRTETNTVVSDSFDNTYSCTDTESEQQNEKTSDGAEGTSTVNAEDVQIRVYPQNTSDSLIQARAASMRRRQDSVPDSTSSSTLGYDAANGTEEVTVNAKAATNISTKTSQNKPSTAFPPAYSEALKRQPIYDDIESRYAQVGLGTPSTVGSSVHQYRRAIQNGVTAPRHRPRPVLTPPPPPTCPPPDSPALSWQNHSWNVSPGAGNTGLYGSRKYMEPSIQTRAKTSGTQPTTGTGQPWLPPGDAALFPGLKSRHASSGNSRPYGHEKASDHDTNDESIGMETANIEPQEMSRNPKSYKTAAGINASPNHNSVVVGRHRSEGIQHMSPKPSPNYATDNGDVYSFVSKPNKTPINLDQSPQYYRVKGAGDRGHSNEGFYV